MGFLDELNRSKGWPEHKEKVGHFCCCGNLVCPYCKAPECYDPKGEYVCRECSGWNGPSSLISRALWNIRAFRVDDYCHCTKCNKWFKVAEDEAAVILVPITD